MAGNSTIRDQIWPDFKLTLDFMVVYLTCKTEEDPIKKEGARVATTFLHGNFLRCTGPANSTVCDRIWPNFELIRNFMVVLLTCKNEEDPIKNEAATTFSHILTIWELYVATETRVLIQSGTNLIQPMMLQIKLRSACWSQRYQCLNVWTDRQTHGHTDAGSMGIL